MKVKIFQQGGEVQPETTPTKSGAEEQLAQMANQIIQELGPEAAGMLAQMIMQMLQSATQTPSQPTYQRQGGKLVKMGGKR